MTSSRFARIGSERPLPRALRVSLSNASGRIGPLATMVRVMEGDGESESFQLQRLGVPSLLRCWRKKTILATCTEGHGVTGFFSVIKLSFDEGEDWEGRMAIRILKSVSPLVLVSVHPSRYPRWAVSVALSSDSLELLPYPVWPTRRVYGLLYSPSSSPAYHHGRRTQVRRKPPVRSYTKDRLVCWSRQECVSVWQENLITFWKSSIIPCDRSPHLRQAELQPPQDPSFPREHRGGRLSRASTGQQGAGTSVPFSINFDVAHAQENSTHNPPPLLAKRLIRGSILDFLPTSITPIPQSQEPAKEHDRGVGLYAASFAHDDGMHTARVQVGLGDGGRAGGDAEAGRSDQEGAKRQAEVEAHQDAGRAWTRTGYEGRYEEPLVGNLIGEDRVNYVLMYNKLTGI
ncbi:hypothetical protein BXZ70DRAFT_909870 [Cristinia sonorae]|uniref:Uncharacterized protein n=1 Tax=Cristinia sonorae TaxID=1940300 RepID=A0A8K0UI06_9AGAR|nr:hypothetical protein BXZ70DRAFT_909870 [Cristinia sonorae]